MESNQKKVKSILFIIQHLYNGGSEATIAKLSLEFSKHFDVHIATFFSPVDFPHSFDYKGKLHCLKEEKNTFLPIKILRRSRFIKKIVADQKIDVVISFLFNADLINALTSSRNHTSIVGIRTSANMLIHSKLKAFLYRYIFKKVDKILVQNKENKNILDHYLHNSLNEKIEVIPNMFDVEGIINRSNENIAFKNSNGVLLSTLGRYSEAKGHRHLIRILAAIKKEEDKNYKLIIIGDGPLKNNYISLGSSLGLDVVECSEDEVHLNQGDVFLIGFRSNPFKYIAKSDLFVFTSYYEGSPNALAEAMIVGTPVISSKCKVGPADLLESKNEDLPEDTAYGTLMPVLTPECLEHDELSAAEKTWKSQLQNWDLKTDVLKEKAKNAQSRMKDYDSKIIIQEWIDVISKASANAN